MSGEMIRVIYACVRCRRLFVGGVWYFGVPAVCGTCDKSDEVQTDENQNS